LSGLGVEKAAIRAAMKTLRDAIPPSERIRMATAIEAALMELSAVRAARVVLMFWSFGSEVPTEGIARRLHSEGRRVLLPYLMGSRMEAGELRDGDALVRTSYGPMEPADRRPVEPGEIDLVVAPGLAFDRDGHRIGYGVGHFDRYLVRLRDDATRVGIAFHQQVIPAIPHGPGDQRLDLLVTDLETVVCPARRPPP
jgi:5-formyltetrahydrofolate cyclo-ligase